MKTNSYSKEQKILKFVQELGWLLDSHKDISFKDVSVLLENRSSQNNNAKKHSLSSDTRFLVGVLPQIFQDEELCPKKEDILDFANQVLGICLNIQSRRSRIEYIGTILCMVSTTSSENRSQLVEALDILLENDSTMREIKRRKKEEPNFSWNEAILKLGKI